VKGESIRYADLYRKLSDAIKDDTSSIRISTVAIEAGIDTLHAETRLVKDETVSIRNALPPLQASTDAVRDAQSLQYHQFVVEWFSQLEFSAQLHDIISRRQDGTAQWFLDSVEFREWIQGPEKTLYCPGIPGAGKTMMAAVAIDHICRTSPNDVGIAYLFCSYKAQFDQTVPSLLSAILKQLLRSLSDIPHPVRDIYDHHSKRRTKPHLDELVHAIVSTLSSYSTVYMVIDALDECSNKDGVRPQLIDNLCRLQASCNVRLLFTSRNIPEVTEAFRSNPCLEVRASEEDVKHYIASHLPRLRISIDDQLVRDIESKIVDAVDGMYVLSWILQSYLNFTHS
jgi:Cdc6-like AAA superfamily ATPase